MAPPPSGRILGTPLACSLSETTFPVFRKAVKCLEACPKSNLDQLVQQVSQIISGKCDANEKETKEFVSESTRFQDKWLSNIQEDGCTGNQASSGDEFCRVSNECVFGKALDASQTGDDSDLVAFSVAFFKFGYLTFAEQRFGGLPSSCDALYEAYQPK
ncbi:hypothetical protein AAVH_25906 [Aphelenchoides avenae]|nr:hypothetical protein AAVH_25906 [Aphelenchus avenae]